VVQRWLIPAAGQQAWRAGRRYPFAFQVRGPLRTGLAPLPAVVR
jgi:hypothetical protein